MGRKGEMELAQIADSVEQHIQAGHRAFVVPVYCMADGISSFKMERMKQAAQEMLLDMGLLVTGMTYDGSRSTAHFEVQVPAPQDAIKTCPKCAEPIKAAAVLCRYCGTELTQEDVVSEVRYDLSPWSIDERWSFTKALEEEGIDFDWDGLELVV